MEKLFLASFVSAWLVFFYLHHKHQKHMNKRFDNLAEETAKKYVVEKPLRV